MSTDRSKVDFIPFGTLCSFPSAIVVLFAATALGVDAPASTANSAILQPAPPTFLPTDANWSALAPHPRLLTSAAKFESLKTQTDDVTLKLRALIKRSADLALAADKPIVYPPTGFLMGQMRTAQARILPLAFEYRMTGDRRYFDRAREELLAVAALPEWRPTHFLDVGEACIAAGVGLDWLYDDLSPDDREQITRAIVANAINPSLETPDKPGSWVRGESNWTQVCHGGVVFAALAIAEREPELARKVVDRAITNFDKLGQSYFPNGSYAEGASYWSYGTSFHVILIESLRTALGTSAGLEKFPGFLETVQYNLQMDGPTGEEFNYSDYHTETLNEPIMLWFARELSARSLARDELAGINRMHELAFAGEKASPGKKVVQSRHLAFELLWWDPTLPDSIDTRALHWTAGGILPLAVMRSAWDDPAASFLAVKGGTPDHSHAHMDIGSFVLEADGVRWANDLGTENYNRMRAAKIKLWNYAQDSTHWSVFRNGPEGHNILRFDNARQDVTGSATITRLPDDNGTVGDVVDLTSLYKNQVDSVRRTVKLHPDKSMSIVDEWTTGDRAVNASFQWLTKATVTQTASGLWLERNGKSLGVKIESDGATPTIAIEDVSAPKSEADSPNPGVSRIVISIPSPAKSTTTLRLTATPGTRP